MGTCRYCGAPLPPESTARRAFCDDTCRKAYHKAAPVLVLPDVADESDAVADAYLSRRDPIDQLAVAVLHARSLARVFLRLSRTTPAPVAWRSAQVGIDLDESLNDNFPDVGE